MIMNHFKMLALNDLISSGHGSIFRVISIILLFYGCSHIFGFTKGVESIGKNDLKGNISPVTVSGRVISNEGRALDNVVILGERGILGTTADDGLFHFEDIGYDEILTFYRYGYEALSLTASETAVKESIILNRDAVSIEGVSVRQQRETIGSTKEMKIIIPVTPELRGRDLPDILRDLPEIHTSGTSLRGERQTVSILGHHARHTLVLLDGIPLNKSGQPFDISTIPTDIIESIEIVKGGAASYRGAGAIGGLININTKYPVNTFDVSGGQEIGSYGSLKTSAAVSHRFSAEDEAFLESGGIRLYADRSEAKNNFTYNDPDGTEKERENNEKFMQNLHLRLNGSFRITPQINPSAIYKLEIFDFDHSLPGPTNYGILYKEARLEGLSIHNYLSIRLPVTGLTTEMVIFHHKNRTKYDNTKTPHPMFRLKSEQDDNKSGVRFFLTPLSDESGLLKEMPLKGVLQTIRNVFWEYKRETFSYNERTNEANSIPEVSQESYALGGSSYHLLPYRSLDWENSLSGRLEYQAQHPGSGSNDKWDRFFSWRYDSALSFFYPFYFSFGGGVSRNYSLPSFYELYWKGDSQTTGNPDLRTERSLNYNLYGEFNVYGVKPRIEYHHSMIDDLIYWYRSVTGWKPGNISGAEIRNLKLSAGYQPHESIGISASWIRTKALNKSRDPDGSQNDLYGKKLIYTPEENFNIGLNMRYSPFFWRVSHSYTGIQWSTPDQLIPPLSSYSLTDTELGMILSKGSFQWQISLILNNIFDTRYEIYAYTPQPGFNWLLNMKVNYKK